MRRLSGPIIVGFLILLVLGGCGNNDADTTSTEPPATISDTETAVLPPQPTQSGPQPTALPTQALTVRGVDADGDGFYTNEEFRDAIVALFGVYEWPDAYQPDVDAVTSFLDREDMAGAEHEVPGEYTVASITYRCAWGQAWLDAYAHADTAAMDLSMANLRHELAVNPMMDPLTKNQFTEYYNTASLGDPTLLRRFVTVNCSGQTWLETSGTPTN